MRFGGRRSSDNVEFREGGGGGFGFGGGGGGGAMLLGLVFSRFGIGGVVVLLLVMFLFGGLGSLTGGGQQAVSRRVRGRIRAAGPAPPSRRSSSPARLWPRPRISGPRSSRRTAGATRRRAW